MICVLIVIVLALVLIGSLCAGGPKQVVKEYYQAIEKFFPAATLMMPPAFMEGIP